jgi:hypothetical protein
MYTLAEKRHMAKELMRILDHPAITMTTVPKKRGDPKPELVVVKGEVFEDIVTERQGMKLMLWNMCQEVMNLEEGSETLGEIIKHLMLMAVDSAHHYFDWDDDFKKQFPEGEQKTVNEGEEA